jgi:hypothetical protein
MDEKDIPNGDRVSTPDVQRDVPRPLLLDDLPPGYYRSVNFIGSVAAVCLMAISLYLEFVLPVCYASRSCIIGPE